MPDVVFDSGKKAGARALQPGLEWQVRGGKLGGAAQNGVDRLTALDLELIDGASYL
jgi:hypothetical protein